MRVGVQFTGSLSPNQTRRWFTFNWPQAWHVVWYMVPITPRPGAPELQWTVQVERSDANNITYWLTVTNLSSVTINFEGRYAVLN
jgi:hypothetical protein